MGEDMECVAIIGMACRFPGARGVSAFWDNLRQGVESIRRFSDQELRAAGVDSAIMARPNYVPVGSVLEDIAAFDAGFFGFSRREAELLDPQQRLFLECTWEALEHAGYDPQVYEGAIGLYGGASLSGYLLSHVYPGLDRTLSVEGLQALLGNDKDYLASRVSYKLDLKGPSIGVQTACSTGLVAVHMACQSLLSRECDVALAGGVTLRVPHHAGYLYEEGGILAPDGRCRAFDARAQGTVFGNGAGVVVLKRLAEALADGDVIYAVVRGSAVNNDGALKIGYTAPSQEGQTEVIAEALAVARVAPETIGFVEAHGTGTPLGDPIEVAALTEAFRSGTSARGFCALGSVKTNIGHLETAAGVAGLMKAVLAIRHGFIPPSLHFEVPNPAIDFAASPFYVCTTGRDWSGGSLPRRAGVSSFGMGGTNAHVVLEQAPAAARVRRGSFDSSSSRVYFLPLSARSPQALVSMAGAYAELLAVPEAEQVLPDLCYSASLRRSHHRVRAGVVGRSVSEVVERLVGLVPPVVSEVRRPLVWVFSGQGGQWVGMGRELLVRESVFREAVEGCARALRPYVGWSVLEALGGGWDSVRLAQADVLQPCVFALQVGLAALWRSWGIEPDAVVGHSLGEVAAAYVVGGLTLEDAALVVFHRSRLLRQIQGRGAMLLVELPFELVQASLVGYAEEVVVGALNSSRAVVLSGEPTAITAIGERLQADGVFCRRVQVDVAFHSPQVEPLCEELRASLVRLVPRSPRVPFYSTVTGRRLEGVCDAVYWVQNVRQPVLFGPAVQRLIGDGFAVFLEVGPHPIHQPDIEGELRQQGVSGAVVASLRRDQDEGMTLREGLAGLYAYGYMPSWGQFCLGGYQYVPPPCYPWQRERFWIVPSVSDVSARVVEHPLLGGRLVLAGMPQRQVWEMRVACDVPGYVEDHRVQGTVVLPGAAYVELALAALARVFGPGSLALEGVAFREALPLPRDGARIVQTVLTEQEGQWAMVEVFSRLAVSPMSRSPWTLHASALGCRAGAFSYGGAPVLGDVRRRCVEEVSSAEHYAFLAMCGLEYGPAFQGVSRLWRGDSEVLGRLRLSSVLAVEGYCLHPALLDACFQMLWAALPDVGEQGSVLYLPVHLDRLQWYGPIGSQVWACVQVRQEGEGDDLIGDLWVYADEGVLVLEGRGLRVRRFAADAPIEGVADWVYQVVWRALGDGGVLIGGGEDGLGGRGHEVVLPSAAPVLADGGSGDDRPDGWLIFADQGGLGMRLVGHLGCPCVVVFVGDGYVAEGSGVYRCSPSQPDDFGRLLMGLAGEVPRRWGVLHLWSLDVVPPDELDGVGLVRACDLGCVSLLHLVQALVQAGRIEVVGLWVATRGVQCIGVGDGSVALGQSLVWGLCRTLGYEHPELGCRVVDLEAGAEDVVGLAALLLMGGGEDQVALRGGCVYGARLSRAALLDVSTSAPVLRADGTYLVSGGLGALGSLVARDLVARGAGQVVLLGRQAPDVVAQRWIQVLRDGGARVVVVQADVSDVSQLAVALGECVRELPPLRGVVHCAGVLDDGVVLQQDRARFAAVLAPKVQGAWNLHGLTLGFELDFFVLFSSTASLLGAPGQANYAAANAFLDGLAQYRSVLGLPALSINWGPWVGQGMAARGNRGAGRGLEGFAPAQGLAALGQLLGQPFSQLGVMRFNPQAWRRADPQVVRRAFFAELIVPDVGERSLVRPVVVSVAPDERRRFLETCVREQVAEVLRLPLAEVDPQMPFSSLGLDSLMSLDLRNRLEGALGLTLPATLVWGYPTSIALAAHLDGLLGGQPDVSTEAFLPSPRSQVSFDQTVAEIVDLTEDDVLAALLGERRT